MFILLKRWTFLCLIIAGVGTLVVRGGSREEAPTGLGKGPPPLSARIVVKIDRKQVTAEGILVSDIDAAIGRFYEQHASFSLEDFSNIELVTVNGSKVLLGRVTKIDVSFVVAKGDETRGR
jgi:hypothetical protein